MSERVVEAVARETGTDPTDLDPLHDVLDADALDRLFRDVPPNTRRDAGRVAFEFGGCWVKISHDGSVQVIPDEERNATSESGEPPERSERSSRSPD